MTERPPHLRVVDDGYVLEIPKEKPKLPAPSPKPSTPPKAQLDLVVEALAILSVARAAEVDDEQIAVSFANWARDYGDARVARAFKEDTGEEPKK